MASFAGRTRIGLRVLVAIATLAASASGATKVSVRVGAPSRAYEGPGGIVLWSNGRSGTSAFWDSLHLWCSSGHVPVDALCGLKEGFRTSPPSIKKVDR